MSVRKLSVNGISLFLGVLYLAAMGTMLVVLWKLTGNKEVMLWTGIFAAVTVGCVLFFFWMVRKKLMLFSDLICRTIDDMLNEEEVPMQIEEREHLFYKINRRLGRMYEVMHEQKRSIAKERKDLQELISDISHQVKTPIANVKMINNTLLEQDVSRIKQKEFLGNAENQLEKLDFLMQSMIKTSRLETGIITLEKKRQSIYDTLAAALGGIILNAEAKQIDVAVNCPENLMVCHDRKWTSEALFNILDNAVKYTPKGGNISVKVEEQEMYVKIDISDNGIGIAEQHQGTIFKRFYREEAVHDVEGIGIGLYLAREIISLQGGYIGVSSEQGKGSTFSVRLLRK